MTKTLVLGALLVSLAGGVAFAQSNTNTTTTQTPAAPPTPPAAAPAPAAVPEVKRVKMRALLAAGYDIKAVTFVSQEVTSRITRQPDNDAALVTLQKGPAAATCFFALSQYVVPGMLDIEWCIEQK